MLRSPSQAMNCRPATPSLMSVPGAVTRTSSWPSIHSASRLHSSEARSQAPSGSGVVGEAGAEVEVLEVAQAHLGVGGVAVGREERVDPAVARPRQRAPSSSPSGDGSPPGAWSGARGARRRAPACWCRRRSRSGSRPPRPPTPRAARPTRAGRRRPRGSRSPTGPRTRSRPPGAHRPAAPPRRRPRSSGSAAVEALDDAGVALADLGGVADEDASEVVDARIDHLPLVGPGGSEVQLRSDPCAPRSPSPSAARAPGSRR